MKKRASILDDLWIWIRGRLTLTNEEKLWMLVVLIILWTGLLGRYAYLKSRTPETLSEQQVETLLAE